MIVNVQTVISDEEFSHFRDIVYRESGINLTPNKRCLVQTRIAKVLRKLGIETYKELFKRMDHDPDGALLIQVLDAISTNHTYFFRENEHFNYLKTVIIPELMQQHRSLNIWSSACSSGEEPYTLAIVLQEYFGTNAPYNLRASDISTRMLKKAQNGIYPLSAIEEIDLELKRKYFQRGSNQYDGLVRVKPALKKNLEFKRHNLLELLNESISFNIIFCRNVMIYFDVETKQKVVDLLTQKLAPGGYLIIGHSESLNANKHKLKMVKPTIYKNV